MGDGCQFIDVFLLNGEFERGGEEKDGMVSWWLRAVGGRRCIAAVQGCTQVANVVDLCAFVSKANFQCMFSEVPGMESQF